MGRFKKHFKGVCWKRKSSDSDVEDDSEKQKTPNGEPSSAKGKKKAQKSLKKDEPNNQVIDLDLHVPKAVKDELDKLERLGALNMESINKFVGTLKFDRHKKLLRLVGECEDDKKEPKHKKVQHVSVNPDLLKNEPRISEIQLPQRVKQRADEDIPVLHQGHCTMPYLQRDNMFSVIHDFPDDEPACVVDESVYVNNTRVIRSLREVGTLTNDTRVSVASTCSGSDAPFPRESGNILVTPVVMKSIACETEYPDVSRKWSNPVVIDNGVKVMKTKPSHTEMKSIAVNTEVVQPTKTGQPLSGLFNPTKVWNLTPFDVYCKRVSVPEPEPLRDGETPYRYLIARPASKGRLSKFNLQIPRAFANVNITNTVEEKSANDLTANSEGGSLIDKGGTDTAALDDYGVAPHMFEHKPTSDDLQTSHTNELDKQQLLEPIHFPSLGMLCRNMFFNGTAHAPNEAGGTIGSYKLSELAMAYTNAAQERLKVDTHTSCERKMIVMPLREMCRQLLGVGGLAKEIQVIDLNTGSGFGTIAKQDYTAEGYQECFIPELNNAGMDEVGGHYNLNDLSVKGQFGGVGNVYGKPKFRQVKLIPNVSGSVPTLINIQQLRLICSKMFFDDLLYFSKQDKSAAGSYKLSDLSMAYLNAAYQRLKAGTQCISVGNKTLYPLREMCRKLLCIVLSKQGPLNGLDMGNGCDLDVRPDVVKDVGGMVYFGPVLPNADLNEGDSVLVPRYGATVTSDGGLKDQRNMLMAVVPYISRSEPMVDYLKANCNGEVEKHRVVEPIRISQLRVLCKKVFFDDIPHASNQAESAASSYKLSGLAMTYINAVQYRLKGGIRHIKAGNMMVLPLREMCHQLFGVGALEKGNTIIDLKKGNGFRTIPKQDYTAEGYQEYLRPEFNNAGMDKIDGNHHLDDLPVKGEFGAVGTADVNLKFPQVQLMAVVPNVSGSVPTLINIQQLRLICSKMFFDDPLPCSGKDKSAAGSYKLSDLSMAYLNAAYQRLKAGTHCISVGNTTIYPLREMCRQLLGIVLPKQVLRNGLYMGNGYDLDVRPDAFKDEGGITGMVYFGPKLPNADLNEVDSVLMSKNGASVTSDGGLKDQRNELMAVVPYIARSEPMHDDLKVKYNCVVEKQRVVEAIHISQLRVLCKKVFFDEIPHGSNQAEIAAANYKLSGLAMTYTNVVQHRLKEGIYHSKVGNMMVLPLREMCRQLFGIGCLRVEGQFCDAPTSAATVTSPKIKLMYRADNTMTKVKQLSRIPKLVLPTIDKGLTTPVGPITLKYLMEKYGASDTFKEIHVKFVCYNLLEGLKFLHKKGIVHKFISPRRIAINSNGYPRLMSDNEVVGPKIQPRIEFTSPELITSGPITTATDIFQVGLLAYSFMYGRSPYKATSYSETKMNLLDDNFTPQFENASMSRDGRYFIKKCLRKDPGMRFSFAKCKRSLEYVVNWFYVFKGEDLANQKYTSPFKDLV